MKFSAGKIALLLFAGLGVLCLLPAHVSPPPAIVHPALHWSTAEERRESLDAMKEAWANRDRTSTPENGVEERRFIFRLNFFNRYVRDTESARDAAALLHATYWDNAAVYGEINRRDATNHR
jgi:hypothetical protein